MNDLLLSELRHIDWQIPDWATPKDAAKMLRPCGTQFVKGSFWRVLCDRLPFARSEATQQRIAEWLFRQRIRTKKAGKVYPPKAFVTKQAIVPAPNPL